MRIFSEQLETSVGAGHRLDRDLGFETGETGTETEMVPPSEREMAIGRARDIKCIGGGELGWITVGGAQRQAHSGMPGNGGATYPNVLGGPSGCGGGLIGVVPAQDLFDGTIDAGGIFAEFGKLFGMLQQCEEAAGNQPLRSCASRGEDCDDRRDNLIFRKWSVLGLGTYQLADQIILPVVPAVGDQRSDISNLFGQSSPSSLFLLRRSPRKKQKLGIFEKPPEKKTVLDRDADHFCGYDDGKMEAEVFDQTKLCLWPTRLPKLVGERRDPVPTALHSDSRKSQVDQRAHTRMIRRIFHVEGALDQPLVGIGSRIALRYATQSAPVAGEPRVAESFFDVAVTCEQPVPMSGVEDRFFLANPVQPRRRVLLICQGRKI